MSTTSTRDDAVAAPPPPAGTASTRTRWVLPLVCAAQLLLQLDFSIVNVALPTMQTELEVSASALQWVVTGYALSFGSLLLLGGRIGDIVGHRRVVLMGLTVFGASSLSGGLATSPLVLIASRIVQGGGAALVAPAVLAILTGTYVSDRERPRALGVVQAATAGGATAGIVLGGILTQLLGWRAVLLVNPPAIAVLATLMARRLPKSAPRRAGRRVDVSGALLIVAGVSAVVFGMSSGQERGFTSPVTCSSLALALVLTVVFVVVERHVEQPILPLSIFHDRTRRACLVVNALAGALVVSYVYFTSLYLQRVLGWDALRTGTALVPGTVMVMAVSVLLSRRFVARLGIRTTLALGMLLAAVGQFWFSRVTDQGTYVTDVLPGLVISAAGIGLAIPAAAVGANADVPAALRGVAGGLFVTAQQIGAAVGLACVASIAATAASGDATSANGYRLAFGVLTGIALVAVVLTVALTPRGTRVPRAS